jgi:predicted SAM-dependent methyltransferase
MIKLHLGCGDIKLEGFINIDVRETPATDMLMDISKLTKFDNNSVDMIYAAHCLEHFSFRDSLSILQEWNRVLKTGGELVLRVPDFDILVNNYLRRHPETWKGVQLAAGDTYPAKISKILRYLAGISEKEDKLTKRIKAVFGLIFPIKKKTLDMNLLGDFLGGQDYQENQHKAFFNEKLLRTLLSEAGFKNIKRVGYSYFPVKDASKHYGTMGISCWKA